MPDSTKTHESAGATNDRGGVSGDPIAGSGDSAGPALRMPQEDPGSAKANAQSNHETPSAASDSGAPGSGGGESACPIPEAARTEPSATAKWSIGSTSSAPPSAAAAPVVSEARAPSVPPPAAELARFPAKTWRPEGELGANTPLNPWGNLARTTALGGLLGLSLVVLLQTAFNNDWIDAFVTNNELAMPARMRVIFSMVAGLGVGGMVAIANLVLAKRRGVGWARVERYYWLLSPFILAPLAPPLLRVEPWRNKHEALLPLMVVVLLFVEALFSKALAEAPERVVRWRDAVAAAFPAWWKRNGPLTVVIVAALFYAAFFGFYTLRWHHKLRTHIYDLGINTNLMAGGLEGKFMHSTVTFPDDPGKYMGAHVKWGGYLFLPIFYFFPRAETLLLAQSTCLGFAAVPLFAFARKRISDWAAVGVSIAFLCYYPMQSANFYEINHVTIATFFIIATAWAVDARRWVLFAIIAFCAASMREDVPIGLAVMGAFLLATGHRPLPGLILAVVGTIWFFVLRFVVMDSVAEWWFPSMYKDLWAPGEKGFGSVIKTLVTNPLFVLSKVVIETKIYYVMHLLVPLALLPARRWYLWAAFIPGFILTLLATDYKPITMHTFQYVMHWTPYLFLAIPLALAAIARTSVTGNRRAWAALATMLVSSFVLTFHYGAFAQREGAFKGGYFTIEFTYSDAERARYEQVKEMRAIVPPDATISTTENVGPHFAGRRFFYSMRHGTHGADYVVAEKDKLGSGEPRKALAAALRGNEYGVVKLYKDLILLKRGHDPAQNAKALRDWKL